MIRDRLALMRAALGALIWALLGALLITLLCQIPARHTVDVGSYDAAYTQGFYEPEPVGTPVLAGSDGSARWTNAASALLFPQAGLPGTVTIRLRGPDGPAPVEVAILLNGATELARVRATSAWASVTVPVDAGLLKTTDFFIELRAALSALPDGRTVGVLVDQVAYAVGPGLVTPYPAQLLYGAVAGVLMWLLAHRGTGDRGQGDKGTKEQGDKGTGGDWRLVGTGMLAYGLIWLLLYRLQPPLYPYPLRALPLWVLGILGALLALRDGPALVARWPWLVTTVAPVTVVGGWTMQTLLLAQAHVTLSRPGVENDFRVFATRTTLAQVFSADGFYNLGYPLLLWLARPLYAGNAFLAGRLVAALAGAVLLVACYWLARSLLPDGAALVALVVLALSGLVAQYGLYVGSDMPFAACVALCVAALVAGTKPTALQLLNAEPQSREAAKPELNARVFLRVPVALRHSSSLWLVALAGVFGGLAFLMRHLGLVLLPWGLLVLLLGGRWRLALAFAIGFLLTMAPQVAINLAQAGQPLYNQQAKNIWLAVYSGTDWGRWDEAPNSIGLAEVLLRDPARVLGNWWRNVVAYLGSGAEDTSEFGRALQLRLLAFPANWLAVGGLLAWLTCCFKGRTYLPRSARSPRRFRMWKHASGLRALRGLRGKQALHQTWWLHRVASPAALLLLVAIYVAAVSTAFTLERFFLPLAPIYAVAAGWALWRMMSCCTPPSPVQGEGGRGGEGLASRRTLLGLALALVVVLWGAPAAGTRYVLDNQPADEVALVRMVETALPPEARIAARVAARLPVAKYSAIAHRVVAWPAGADMQHAISPDDLAEAHAAEARYLLWDEAAGPPPLTNAAAARVASTGRYALYRMTP